MRPVGWLLLLLAPAVAHGEPTRAGASSGPPTIAAVGADVVGGAPVPSGRWPDAVAVIGDSGTCTGTLIAPDIVLTAGHCAELAPSEIIAATTDYGTGGTSIAVRSVTAYPSWRTSYDLAVLVLEKPVPGVAPRAVGAACTYAGIAEGTMVHLVGFGLTTEQGDDRNTVLHEAMAAVVDPSCMGAEGCRKAIAPGGEFVAGGGGKDSCFGDSGGPVYLDTPRGQVLVGATSRGVAGSTTPCGDGGVYERTDKVIAWIEQVAGEKIAVDSCDADAGGTTFSDDHIDVTGALAGGCAAGGGAGGSGVLVVIGTLAAAGARRRRQRVRPAMSA